MLDVLPHLATLYAQARRTSVVARLTNHLEMTRDLVGGRLNKDAYSDDFPRLLFSDQENRITCTVLPRDRELEVVQVNLGYTAVSVGETTHPYPPTELFSKGMDTAVQATIRKVLVGDSVIDNGFIVRARDEAPARRLLVKNAREALLGMHFLSARTGLYFGLEFDRALFKKRVPSQEVTSDFLLHLHALGSSVVRALREQLVIIPPEEVMEIMASLEDGDKTRCQVCGDRVVLDRIACKTCDTPHHRECWEYNGRCAIFGCGEKRYR